MTQSARAATLRSTTLSFGLSLALSLTVAITTGLPVSAQTPSTNGASQTTSAKPKAAKSAPSLSKSEIKSAAKPQVSKKSQTAKSETAKPQAGKKPEGAKPKSQAAKSEDRKPKDGKQASDKPKAAKSEVQAPKAQAAARSASTSTPKAKAEGKAAGKAETKTGVKAASKNSAPPAIAPAGIEAASRKHATLPPPPARKPAVPAAMAATSSTPQADADAVENVVELVRKHRPDDATQVEAAISDPVAKKLAEWIILRSEDNGASVERYRAFIAANPSWPSQTFLRRRLEAALWDDHRDDATVWSWFENESPLSAKGKIRSGAGADRPRRAGQCRTPRARCLAQRWNVRSDRKCRARPVRRAADARRPKGQDGFFPLRHGRGCCRVARGQDTRQRRSRTGEGTHRLDPQVLQRQGVARGSSARVAWGCRLHLQQDSVAPPRGEIRRSSPADAERAEGPEPAV